VFLVCGSALYLIIYGVLRYRPVKYTQNDINIQEILMTTQDSAWRTIRRNRPSGLPDPYDYLLPRHVVAELVAKLRYKLKKFESCAQVAALYMQHRPAGVLIQISVTACATSFRGAHSGDAFMTAAQWHMLCRDLRDTLFAALGKYVAIYADDFSDCEKFQISADVRVGYAEHFPKIRRQS
jgi:hypothetical protein